MCPTDVPENKDSTLNLDGRVNIMTDQPLPEFNTSGGLAFAAQLRGTTGSDLVGIVCANNLPVRTESIAAMRTIDHSSSLRLRDSGVVGWPARNARYFSLIYERPLSPRYWQTMEETRPTMSEDALNHLFVMPLVKALMEYERTGIIHGGIRPTNLYWRHASATPPQFGECLSAPTGHSQPILFETIERGMCPHVGRGTGLHVDDCYAFGVLIACAIFGQNPMAGMDDQMVMHTKLEKGSFNAIVGSRRLASSHIELLRGLLTDDVKQRWSASDIDQWLAGRRLTPKSSDAGRRASRHFDLAGKEYWQVRPLASAIAANTAEAVKVIESGGLERWLMRSLGDEERSKAVSETISQLKESGKSSQYEHQLCTRVCIALDPIGPLRYRGISVMLSGIPDYLADLFLTNSNLQIISEMISMPFVAAWANAQKEMRPEFLPMIQQMDRARGIIEKTSYGNGIERVLYDINPSLPCLSPMLRNYYISGAKALLPALELIAKSPNRPTEPMDRHIASFLLVRDKRSEGLFLAMAPSEAPVRRGVAILTLLSEIQYRYGPEKLPALTAWMMPMVEANIKRFLNKSLQEKVRREAKQAIEKGDLGDLLKAVDDPKRIGNDEQDFLRARLMHRDLTRNISELESTLANRNQILREVGRPFAATVASFIALLMIALTLGRAMLQMMIG